MDITTGDVITPGAVSYAFHSIFDSKVIEVRAYTIETILAEKVETILRRSVLNTRPRYFHDVYILMKTQGQILDESVLRKAFLATAQKRESLAVLENREKILVSIQADSVMQERWARYSKEYPYASGIGFDEIMMTLREILNAL
jgi:hypothetical protein